MRVIYIAQSFLLVIVAMTLLFVDYGVTAQVDKTTVENIRARYGQTNTFDANFEQILTHRESGSTEKRTGRMQFQKPLLIRWQTSKPNEETLVINDKEIWDYLPDEEIAYRYSPKVVQDSRSIIQVLTGQAAMTRDFDVKNAGKENGLTKLTLYPKEPTTQMVEGTLWVEPEAGYIKRAKITDFYGNTNDVRFTDFKPGIKIPANQFKFTPPRGIDVEDRTKDDAMERELFK